MGVKVLVASSAFTPEVVASAEKREAQKRISGLRALEACVTLTKYLCQSVRNRHSGGVPLRQRKSPLRFPVNPLFVCGNSRAVRGFAILSVPLLGRYFHILCILRLGFLLLSGV